MIDYFHQVEAAAEIDSKINWESDAFAGGWHEHNIVKFDGENRELLPASFQLMSAPWGHDNVQMPTMVYMPEKGRLLLLAQYGPTPVRTIISHSDDNGATWSDFQPLHDGEGNEIVSMMAVGLNYLGDGVLTFGEELNYHGPVKRWFSYDYGESWTKSVDIPLSSKGEPLYYWDPMLIDRDEQGNITRLLEGRYYHTGREWDSGEGPYSQACTWQSTDLGETWSAEQIVPQWLGVNEVALIRAKNDDIVAVCRTDNAQRFIGELDWYSGLAISISKDNGATWSDLNVLYEFGRHHQSLVMLENGDILMTYAVRQGYEASEEGYPQFGIEAIVSTDNGQTWDLEQRYVLATWRGKILGENAWWGLAQSTTTAQLPDGSFVTAFGTGTRNLDQQEKCIMDLGLVQWRLKVS